METVGGEDNRETAGGGKAIVLQRWRKIKYHRYLLHLTLGNSFRSKAPFTRDNQTKISRRKRFLILLYSSLTSHLGLILVLVVHTFMGALVFQHVEGATGRRSDDVIMKEQQVNVIQDLLNELLTSGLVHPENASALQVVEAFFNVI